MKAIIVGATGATGSDLLNQILSDERFSKVIIFVRRTTGISNEKLEENIIDFDQPALWKDNVKGDVLYSCLGTTLKAAGNKEGQWKIDYEYQLEFARFAKINEVPTFVLVSADYASPDAKVFYSRMKGQLEKDISSLGFQKLLIFRPPILIRNNTDRNAEKIGIQIIKFFNHLGMLQRQKPLSTKDLAKAMIEASVDSKQGISIYIHKEIRQLIDEN